MLLYRACASARSDKVQAGDRGQAQSGSPQANVAVRRDHGRDAQSLPQRQSVVGEL